jgi:hypothetical protein
MALINCPDCGFEHSDQAAACPKCGRPNKPPVSAKIESSKNKSKIGCLPGCLITFVTLIFIGAIGSQCEKSEQLTRITNCNTGSAEACEALLGDSDFEEFDSITNSTYKSRFQDKKRAAEQASANANRLSACETVLKATLKDPDSLKIIDRDYANVTITYSATNSFGGRIKNVIDCNTGKNYD